MQMIPGPVGALEARVTPGETDRWAVLCHPHPLYGGSMDDGVLDVARRCLERAGMGTVLFNFRGVGNSEGQHDGAGGEVDDLATVLWWLAGNHRVQGGVTLIGYSFGSSVAWQGLTRFDDAGPVVLIAPPIGNMAFPDSPGAQGTVIAGSDDAFIDRAARTRFLNEHAGMRFVEIPGADHFFSGGVAALSKAVSQALA